MWEDVALGDAGQDLNSMTAEGHDEAALFLEHPKNHSKAVTGLWTSRYIPIGSQEVVEQIIELE